MTPPFVAIALALLLGLAAEPSLAVKSRGHTPIPSLDEKTPASARALLEWFALTYGERMNGTRACPPLTTLSAAQAFPRDEAIDAAFLEYSRRGGLWEAIAIDRLGTFEERLAQMESSNSCVRIFASHTVGYELAGIASTEGREPAPEEAAELLEALSTQGYDPSRLQVRYLWKDFSVAETLGTGDLFVIFLRSRPEGWTVIGQAYSGVSCEFQMTPPTLGNAAPPGAD